MAICLKDVIASGELVLHARSGNPAALVDFATQWWPVIGRIAWSMLGNVSQAIAVTEEVLCTALDSCRPLEFPAGYAMVRDAIWLAIVRRRSRRSPPEARTPLFELLDTLDNFDRAAWLLRDIEGLTAADAAAVLETSQNGIKQRARRARVVLTRAVLQTSSLGIAFFQRRSA